ncbi:MAG TPA: hypothetical protein VIL20_27360, partial [Sandaracinaceae bacterium]
EQGDVRAEEREATAPDAPDANGPAPRAEADENAPAPSASASEGSASEAPKIAVVVVGDPEPPLRDAARRVEDAARARLRLPFDEGLRAALCGEPGAEGDGFEEVRRERRRLGWGESRDAPILAALGRRAGARAVAVVRTGAAGPELLVLDVSTEAFFEGALALREASDARIARFVERRARAAGRTAPPPEHAARTAREQGDAERPSEPQPARQPDLFEQIWPYLVAGGLLAALLIGIAVTSTSAGSNPPVLRFVPGGR